MLNFRVILFAVMALSSFLLTTTSAFHSNTMKQRWGLPTSKSGSLHRLPPRVHLSMSGPAVIERETVEEKKAVEDPVNEKDAARSDGGWEVRLYNDPFNKREFVARCLTVICGLSDSGAYQVMMQAHNNGLAVIGCWVFEVAEGYYEKLKENGLSCDMVPVDEE